MFDSFNRQYNENYISPCEFVKKFVFYDRSVIIGALKVDLYPKQSHAILRFLAIDTSAQGAGHGTRFLQLLHQWLRLHGYTKVLVNADCNAVTFYKKNGHTERSFPDDERIDIERSIQMSYDV